MANLLPTKNLELLRGERARRLATVVLIGISASLLTGAILLLPSLVLSLSQARDARERLEATKELIAARGLAGAAEEIRVAGEYINLLEAALSYQAPSGLIAEAVSAAPEGVSLSRIAYARTESGAVTLTLAGEAATREALLRFADNLRTSPAIARVDLPVSHLAARADVPFTLTIAVAESEQNTANPSPPQP